MVSQNDLSRRGMIAGASALGLAGAVATHSGGAVAADAWPKGPITMIVPFPPGGQADLAARPIAEALQRILKTTVIVENRQGAGGAVGNGAAAKAAPDGQTVLMTLASLAVLPEAARLFDRPPLYEMAQLRPVARVLGDPTMLAVPANAPWQNVADLVAAAKAQPGTIPYGSSGTYGTLHVSMEMFTAAAGIKLLHVAYRGAGPALNDLISGQVKALASSPGTLKQHVEAGTLRVLANFGAERVATFPNVPTFKETGYPDVELYIWAGLFTPAGVPEPVFDALRAAMAEAMRDANTRRVFETAGSPPAYLDAEAFGAFVAADSARLITAVRKIGKVE